MQRSFRKIRVRDRRHDSGRTDIIISVGQPLPPFYEIGRRPGELVQRIEGPDPFRCVMSHNDDVLIDAEKVFGAELA